MPVSRKRKKLKNPAGIGKPALPDRRALESLLAMLSTSLVEDGPEDDALAEAQDLMWTAWDTPDRRRRVAMAKRALTISPLCADAYVLLAQETAQTPAEAIELYRQGIAAGEQALGPAAFEEDVGHFWGILETRPYMRARNGLAQALWETGEAEAALDHYRELLRLNPNDNQGNRYLLGECLLKLDRDDELIVLLDRYERDWSADFSYTAALVAFRRNGDTAKARTRLRQALKINAHVPAYLLGRMKVPRALPAYLELGGKTEAEDYARRHAVCWERTPMSLQWLADNATQRDRKPAAQKPRRPGPYRAATG
jgi:tetratricopeptide (TPR) repeat protein